MRIENICLRGITYCLSLQLLLIGVAPIASRAELITSVAVAHQLNHQSKQQKVVLFLSRAEVATQLSSYGIESSEAVGRVYSLTDKELEDFAARIDDLPAGGDGMGTVIGALIFVFVLLLVTDILGLTKVYPFTRSIRYISAK